MRHGQGRLAGFGEPCGELGQVTAFAEELALAVDHFQVHLQVVFHLLRRLGPRLIADPRTGHAQQFTPQRLGQRALAEFDTLQRSLDEVRHRHEVFAQRLGQVAHQSDALGFDQPRHQPLQALGWQRRQQRRRHPQGHAVTGVVGFEVVTQGQGQVAQVQGVRVMRGGDFTGLAGQHVFFTHDQQLRVFLAVDLIPTVKGGGLVNLCGQARIVKGVQGFFVGQDVATAGLGFQLVELLQQFLVGRQALGTGLNLAAHQAFTNKQLTGHHRVNRPVMHRPAPDHDQPEQGDLLKGHHLAALLLPMGFEVVFLDQMPGQRLDPVGVDFRHHACIELGGFHQFGGHQPLRALLADARRRVNPEATLARAEVIAVFGLLADLAEQAGQYRFMQLRIVRGLFVEAQLHVAADQAQLTMGVAPLAQAQVVEEVFAAPVAQRAGGQFLALLLETAPQVDQPGEV